MTAPTVSVCIPAYNAGGYVVDAIESVLTQGVDDIEIVVLDDDSPDDTYDRAAAALAGDGRATVARNERRLGAAGNWSAVLGRARGRYVKLLCSDDLLEPGGLRRQVEALDAEPAAALASGRRRVIAGDGRTLVAATGMRRPAGRVAGAEAVRRIVRSGGNPVGEPSAVLFRRDALAATAGVDDRWSYVIDLALYTRLLEHGDLLVVDDVTAAFRVWPESWSTRLARQQAAETRRWHRTLRDAGLVTAADVAVGSAMARARQAARALVRRRAG